MSLNQENTRGLVGGGACGCDSNYLFPGLQSCDRSGLIFPDMLSGSEATLTNTLQGRGNNTVSQISVTLHNKTLNHPALNVALHGSSEDH